uniref:alpha/beta fold hydrolase n=1 Tax=Cronobacter dublinensis TaxID=413497 RepID=UPI00358DC9CE
RDYQVVVYDQRGTGDNADTLPEGYTLADMAQELHRALLIHGVHRYAVLGHALGGLVGLELALAFPEAVSALVIVTAGCHSAPGRAAALKPASGCCSTAALQRISPRNRCFSTRRRGRRRISRASKPKKRCITPIFRAPKTCCAGCGR